MRALNLLKKLLKSAALFVGVFIMLVVLKKVLQAYLGMSGEILYYWLLTAYTTLSIKHSITNS